MPALPQAFSSFTVSAASLSTLNRSAWSAIHNAQYSFHKNVRPSPSETSAVKSRCEASSPMDASKAVETEDAGPAPTQPACVAVCLRPEAHRTAGPSSVQQAHLPEHTASSQPASIAHSVLETEQEAREHGSKVASACTAGCSDIPPNLHDGCGQHNIGAPQHPAYTQVQQQSSREDCHLQQPDCHKELHDQAKQQHGLSGSEAQLDAQAPAQKSASSSVRVSTAQTSSSSSSTGGVKDVATEQRECRICLQQEDQADLVAACGCSGTMQYAHLACLKSWCAERRLLVCELCGQEYSGAGRDKLEAAVAEAQERHAQEVVIHVQAQAGDGGQQGVRQVSWVKFWIHVTVLTLLLAAALYMALFTSPAMDSFWMVFLWRVLTVVLPLFLIIRTIAAIHTWRKCHRARQLV